MAPVPSTSPRLPSLPSLPVSRRLSGVYAITPDELDSALMLSLSAAMLEAGVRTIQYRRKLTPVASQLIEARQLQELATAFGASLIINDDLALALAVGAAGVHWGRDDVGSSSVESLAHEIDTARARAEAAGHAAPLIVGISCYNDFARARWATEAGADYIAFGSMFASSTKPFAAAAPVDLIASAKQKLEIPVVAIGGITRDNVTVLIEAGVDAVAIITDLYSAADSRQIAERVKEFEQHFRMRTTTNKETI
ncbi:MAG: thiamine phosphate synthase [Rhodocyclaceae bacterium]|nr:thiamine phosphate synthase [Rhodocyclaceae bacterium]